MPPAGLVLTAGLVALLTPLAAPAQVRKAASRRVAGKMYTSPRIYEVSKCKRTKSTFLVHDVQILIDARGGDYVVSDVELTNPFPYIRKMTIILTRCRGAATQRNCEYFTTWSWATGLCTLLPAKGVLWTPFVQSIVPSFKCPIPIGKYRVNNGTFDLDILDAIMKQSGIYDHVWLIEVHLYDETPDINICFNVTFEARRLRRRPS